MLSVNISITYHCLINYINYIYVASNTSSTSTTKYNSFGFVDIFYSKVSSGWHTFTNYCGYDPLT